MISLILIWCYIAIVIIIYGITGVRFLRYLFKIDNQQYPPLTIIFILGLCIVTTICGYLSLFINLGLTAFVLTFLAAIFIFIYYYKEIVGLFKEYLNKLFSFKKYLLIIFAFSIFFIVVKSTNPPASVDTGLYHAQAIKWSEEYRVVPGLGNLHGRLAFNFSWFLPSALFSLSFLKIQPFHVLNPLLLIFVLIMSFEAGDEIIKGHISFANLLKIAIIIPIILVFKNQLSPPNVDMPAALLILVLFIYFIEMLENETPISDGLGPIIVALIAVYGCTVKLSSIPIMVFGIFITLKKIMAKKYTDMLIILGIILIILAPWIIRNIILSGYLVYPFQSLDFFNFDWKIPLKAVVAESRAVSNYARNPGLIPDEWLSGGLSSWFPSWLHYVITGYRKKLEFIVMPALFILAAIIINSFREKSLRINYDAIRKYKIVYLTAVTGVIFWFFTAPDLRLGYGFIMITPLLVFIPITASYRPFVAKSLLWLTFLVLLYFEIVFITGDLPALKNRLILPAPYPEVALQTIRVGEQVVYVPQAKTGLCWYAPLPCTPYPVANLEFRGNNLQDGFRSKKE